MSISNINTKGPLNQTQRAQLKTAREVKQNVLKTASRFQSLDQTPADVAGHKEDTVFVSHNEKADLPQSLGNKVARLAVGILAPKEEDAKASGLSIAKDGKIEDVSVVTQDPTGKESEYNYRKLDDGSEIYHGPTQDGYAVVRENKDGTLMMMTSDKPANAAYWDASKWESPKSEAATAEDKPAPKTFSETLRDLASGQQATGPGTINGRAEVAGAESERTPSVEQAGDEPPQTKVTQSGFLTSFGESTSSTVGKVKQGGESLAKDVGDSLKDASDTVEDKSKGAVQSVKDWSQSDTGQKVGDLLFGIANPWKKKG